MFTSWKIPLFTSDLFLHVSWIWKFEMMINGFRKFCSLKELHVADLPSFIPIFWWFLLCYFLIYLKHNFIKRFHETLNILCIHRQTKIKTLRTYQCFRKWWVLVEQKSAVFIILILVKRMNIILSSITTGSKINSSEHKRNYTVLYMRQVLTSNPTKVW